MTAITWMVNQIAAAPITARQMRPVILHEPCPTRTRRVHIMMDQGYDAGEVADILGLPISAVKHAARQYSRAKRTQ